ncbi:MAG: HAD-IA family hydrolase [Ruminiclostridium sp.]|nr:HAD-IA family hydrolase [Ruminiclostridium sp.]
MIKAVIFDMYETLVSKYSQPRQNDDLIMYNMYETLVSGHTQTPYLGKHICIDSGIPEDKFYGIWHTTEDDRTTGKLSLEEVIERILKENGKYTDELFNMIIHKRKTAETAYFEHLHPEIIPMLRSIRNKGVKTGLVTNCFFEERDAIIKSPLYTYFDAVCMSCELGLMKPDKEIFLICTEKLAVRPEECLYVGDGGSKELETAASLGMNPLRAVWYLQEHTQQPSGINDSFPEIKTPMEIPEHCVQDTEVPINN